MSKTKSSPKKAVKQKSFLKEVGLFAVDILYNALIIILLVILIRSFLISPFRVVGSSMADTLQSDEFILINKLDYRIGEPERGDAIVFKPPITNKYPHKFEVTIETDQNGIGTLDLEHLRSVKNTPYCQNRVAKLIWLCHNTVQADDLVYFRQGSRETWQESHLKTLEASEIQNGTLTIEGRPNETYLVRIYDSEGPEYFVKRIIGIPGDVVRINNGRVYLKTPEDDEFVELEEDYLNEENKDRTYFLQRRPESNEFKVPEGSYFTMGDNRNHSNDSRSWLSPIHQDPNPYVPKESISGTVLMVLWPIQNMRFILH